MLNFRLNLSRKQANELRKKLAEAESAKMIEFFDEHKDRITVYHLPTFSPDYNPIEKLWKKVKQAGTHLHYFPTFESLILKV